MNSNEPRYTSGCSIHGGFNGYYCPWCNPNEPKPRELNEAINLAQSGINHMNAAYEAMRRQLSAKLEVAEKERDELEFQRKTLCNTLTEVSLERDALKAELAEAQECVMGQARLSLDTKAKLDAAKAEIERLKKKYGDEE